MVVWWKYSDYETIYDELRILIIKTINELEKK